MTKLLKFAHALYKGSTHVEAMKAAGYSAKKASLERHAARLLKTSEVQNELKRLSDKNADRSIAEREEVLKLLTAQVRGGMADFLTFDEDGDPFLDLTKAREAGVLNMIEGIDFDTLRIKAKKGEPGRWKPFVSKLKLLNNHSAIERLAKMMGWNEPEKHQHQIEVAKVKGKLNFDKLEAQDKAAILKVIEHECSAA